VAGLSFLAFAGGRRHARNFFRHKNPIVVSLSHQQRMKLIDTLKASLLVVGASAALQAQEPAKPAAAPATPAAAPAPQFTEAQVLETFGWFVGKRVGLSELQFTKEQTDIVIKGLLTAAAGKEAPYDLQKIGPEVDKFMQEKQQQYAARMKTQGQAESEKFLAEMKAKKGVTALPNGLLYEIVKPGTGEYPKVGDVVTVHYTGTLVNGTKFDSSEGGQPAEFTLANDSVIAGWVEGLQKINKGGKIKLYIPPALAYGENGPGQIPPNSALVFDVELIDFKPPAAAPASATGPATPPPVKK
jgi:FKBP-type peptidyl-prolyl cis-trans isomerase